MGKYLGRPTSGLHRPFLPRISDTCNELHIPTPLLRPPVVPDVPTPTTSLARRSLLSTIPGPPAATAALWRHHALRPPQCTAHCSVQFGRQYTALCTAHCMLYSTVWQALHCSPLHTACHTVECGRQYTALCSVVSPIASEVLPRLS